MSTISTYVFDLARGRPASGMDVTLERLLDDGSWTLLGHGHTDREGRLASLAAGSVTLVSGIYRVSFATGAYYIAHGISGTYPEIRILLTISEITTSCHLPLSIAPYGYFTYFIHTSL